MVDPIISPIKINTLEIKNRIFLPAMHMNMAVDYEVTQPLIDFYAQRAKGGAGMIVVGFATIDKLSSGTSNIGAHKDEFIPGLKRLADAIKDNGARAAVQINHAGKNSFSFMIGEQAVSASAVPSRMTRETPRELTEAEIWETIDSFAAAAVRVQKAGYDAVEILAGTGYLISSFLSPVTNQRKDSWGGSFENRMRFGIEIIKAIRKATGEDYPIIARINGNDLMKGGVGRKDLQVFAQELVKAGADALNINVGWHEARIPQIVTFVPRGVFGYLSKGIKELVDVPVIASHRINDPALAREMIQEGQCDMVAMGRPLIADPELPNKIAAGKEKEIIHCIACAQGCFDHLFEMKTVQCLCNPKAGREKDTVITRTDSPKKVMIIGAGAAGMSAALAAKEKGHNVTVYEKESKAGGQLYLAAAPPGREEFSELAKDLATQLRVNDINIVYNQTVDKALIEKEKPDHVILATGARPMEIPIPGKDRPNVVQAWDVLLDKVTTGKRVVVVGGGAVGVETALFLAEKGTLSPEALKFLLINEVEDTDYLKHLAIKGSKEVIMLEMLDKIGKDIGKSTRWVMMEDMARYNVVSRTATKVLEITDKGVRVEYGGEKEEIAADTIVLATGSVPENGLQKDLEQLGIPFTVTGDAKQIRLAFDAVHNGFEAGRNI
ncbi:MAG: FAD-dependent oxidoreductase [Proteobacteria bacterium]|nr:FAD-dependent oxidoreductase [Pseudomonadota bacterium]MBU1388644.1 FAD-dependent oxidoreductase [Pseudomonadota bacterium]MBU1544887.1 FAD-dependent oxidoreductase [Pseudomonadota bacterium]MBU2429339.1 FAD-dependent oxidoreductase [Pseudomonadota bacterium]MBU2479473.1 FAD-dependent oxidoreductase [Pseudomonadota bacterium]